jgi:NTE family protein
MSRHEKWPSKAQGATLSFRPSLKEQKKPGKGKIVRVIGWERVKARKRAAELAREPHTAFVLTGGGVLGAVQAGQLQALMLAGVTPDVVIGTSVGSLNAAYIASRPHNADCEELVQIWRSVRTEDIFPGSRLQRAWHIVARGDHIYPNDGIRRLVEKLPIRMFEEASIPLHISATNLTTGAETWFTEGPLMRAILASTALPGIFPPIAIDGELFVDGGVVNNAPISRAVELGAKRIYLLQCGGKRREALTIRRPLDVLVHAFAHSRAIRLEVDLSRYAGDVEIIAMPTVETAGIRYNDLSQTPRLIEAAREASELFLAHAQAQEA